MGHERRPKTFVSLLLGLWSPGASHVMKGVPSGRALETDSLGTVVVTGQGTEGVWL